MRVELCLVAFMIGYVYATTCTGTDRGDCDVNVTICSSGYNLTCVDTTDTDKHCVCFGNEHGAHTCNTDSDCSNGGLNNHHHGHTCHDTHHWICQHGHCHCHPPHGGGHGQHGGK